MKRRIGRDLLTGNFRVREGEKGKLRPRKERLKVASDYYEPNDWLILAIETQGQDGWEVVRNTQKYCYYRCQLSTRLLSYCRDNEQLPSF